ncbi:MAG TPA: RNA polymerase sigma factor [Sphingopyxis sp.]|nr:RNA polymerase sigma factor [Sphingopyxis sp.]HMP43728.1 RNA polymerase sigma factor [Sphingopyxis sp.]
MTGDRRRRDDEYLVGAAQSGDGSAFAALVRRWHKRLVAHAWRLTGTREAAEDAVQAGWVDIVRALPALRDERVFPAWAFRIVTRRALKAIAARKKDSIAFPCEHEEVVRAVSIAGDNSGELVVDRQDLRRAIAALSPAHRAALALHYFEELSIAEIAVALDAPVGTIKTRLMHARLQLRRNFEGAE